ncbi:hypothetical protein CBR_g36959 [Chara braunii]|uniref:Uncharacterized protein n=1 Tax=Chara braunii TaxID=69332 RepID=A0A388JZE6_CHABU|nr:hypothetical protein CBR_g36959 [Chara braunii]|eukprot:GBG63191.1 hypothetical protein CBR_g36959 [Chara braunii]
MTHPPHPHPPPPQAGYVYPQYGWVPALAPPPPQAGYVYLQYGWVPASAPPPPPAPPRPPAPNWNYSQPSYHQKTPVANSFPASGNRAWFTREHLELIEKWKTKELEESKKPTEDSCESSKQGATKKGRGKATSKSEDGEQNLKTWMVENFGSSLTKIAEKLEVVDKKSKEAEVERVKLVKMVQEIEGKGATDGGNSNEKRKQVVGVNSPTIEWQKLRSRSRSGGVKIRQPRIDVSSDNEKADPASTTTNSNPGNVKQEDVMKMLSVITGKVQCENANSGTGAADTHTKKGSTVVNIVEEDNSTESEDEMDKLKLNRGSCAKSDRTEAGIIEYMRQRLDHYMDMNGTKIKILCLKRNVKWERKDKSAWELAKQDTGEFSKLVHGDNEQETEPDPEEEEEDNCSDGDADDDDLVGN